MAAAEKGFGRTRTDPTKVEWEQSEFPIVCETCLGDNPYVRMSREKFGSACHVCERPYTKFRWKAGSGRFKNTVLCQMCAKLKNVCQVCMFDLQYGEGGDSLRRAWPVEEPNSDSTQWRGRRGGQRLVPFACRWPRPFDAAAFTRLV